MKLSPTEKQLLGDRMRVVMPIMRIFPGPAPTPAIVYARSFMSRRAGASGSSRREWRDVGRMREGDAMIPRNRLLRVVALPAFEGLPAQVVFIRKYGERW